MDRPIYAESTSIQHISRSIQGFSPRFRCALAALLPSWISSRCAWRLFGARPTNRLYPLRAFCAWGSAPIRPKSSASRALPRGLAQPPPSTDHLPRAFVFWGSAPPRTNHLLRASPFGAAPRPSITICGARPPFWAPPKTTAILFGALAPFWAAPKHPQQSAPRLCPSGQRTDTRNNLRCASALSRSGQTPIIRSVRAAGAAKKIHGIVVGAALPPDTSERVPGLLFARYGRSARATQNTTAFLARRRPPQDNLS